MKKRKESRALGQMAKIYLAEKAEALLFRREIQQKCCLHVSSHLLCNMIYCAVSIPLLKS